MFHLNIVLHFCLFICNNSFVIIIICHHCDLFGSSEFRQIFFFFLFIFTSCFRFALSIWWRAFLSLKWVFAWNSSVIRPPLSDNEDVYDNIKMCKYCVVHLFCNLLTHLSHIYFIVYCSDTFHWIFHHTNKRNCMSSITLKLLSTQWTCHTRMISCLWFIISLIAWKHEEVGSSKEIQTNCVWLFLNGTLTIKWFFIEDSVFQTLFFIFDFSSIWNIRSYVSLVYLRFFFSFHLIYF